MKLCLTLTRRTRAGTEARLVRQIKKQTKYLYYFRNTGYDADRDL